MPAYPTKQISLVCKSCDQFFSVPHSKQHSVYGPRLFCSRFCQNTWRTHDRIEKKCDGCDNILILRPNDIKRGRGKYCSISCSLRSRTYPSASQRFWKKVDKRDDESCWPWLGGTFPSGYGNFRVSNQENGIPAPRFSYEEKNGQIPDGLLVCHDCDNPLCVNPSHLFLGTHQDNMDDAISKMRHTHGEKQHSSKLKETDILLIRSLENIMTTHHLSKKFGVSMRTIRDIIRRKTWVHI